METQEIQTFIYRLSQDQQLRHDLLTRTDETIQRCQLSPRVARILLKLVPHLNEDFTSSMRPHTWWY